MICDTTVVLEEPSLLDALYTYLNFIVFYIFGVLRDVLRYLKIERRAVATDHPNIKFVPLHKSFESFYARNVYFRVRDCFERPVISAPGCTMTLKERITTDYNWSFRYGKHPRRVINIGSYNYLGFAENTGECVDRVIECIRKHGVGQCSANQEAGYKTLHRYTEKRVATFIGTDDAIVFGMGFATNSTNIPALIGKGCLVLSDERNHSSIVLGCRLSGATIKVFRHCDMDHLEMLLRENITMGNKRTFHPWKKILIVVEGIYSMEGTIVPLPKLIELKRRYKAYLFVDEAHSIGAIGNRGRGVVDYFKCNPRDVDILMGTFTKSFNSCGGYIAGKKDVISYIRKKSHAQGYAPSMSPPIMEQIIGVIDYIEQCNITDNTSRIAKLAWNTKYLRNALRSLNFVVYGNDHSPVVPIMLFGTSKIRFAKYYPHNLFSAFNREMLKRNIAVVTVGFPATPLTLARARFCVSAGHTKEMLDNIIEACREVGDLLHLRVSTVQQLVSNCESMVAYDVALIAYGVSPSTDVATN